MINGSQSADLISNTIFIVEVNLYSAIIPSALRVQPKSSTGLGSSANVRRQKRHQVQQSAMTLFPRPAVVTKIHKRIFLFVVVRLLILNTTYTLVLLLAFVKESRRKFTA